VVLHEQLKKAKTASSLQLTVQTNIADMLDRRWAMRIAAAGNVCRPCTICNSSASRMLRDHACNYNCSPPNMKAVEGTFSKWGGTMHVKNTGKFFSFFH